MNGSTPHHGRLTPAQINVIACYARGQNAPQIAAVLGISPRTVRSYCKRAAICTNVEGRTLAALVDQAYRRGAFTDAHPDLARKAAVTPPELRLPHSLHRTLQCLAKGLSTQETAREFGVSPATVKEYRRRLYETLGTESAPQAVAIGWQNRLLGPAASARPGPRPQAVTANR
ncbi:LuxR C-terminal-related transcriptional regulator [Streptomyces griseorubiginosus]|uniref:LuxR C-terminal-related transcriptional regulator n=1 Tax=Streptomyces griseorubiginosus TaxID=67304 RepID=UPI003641C202